MIRSAKPLGAGLALALLLWAGLPASGGAAAGTVPKTSCVPTVLYSNGFESGTNLSDWSEGTFLAGGNTNDWRGIQKCTAQAGNKIFRFGGKACAGNYDNDRFAFVQPNGSAGISVPAGANVTRLSFWHRRAFETGFDGATLAISVDGANYFFIPSSAILSGTSYNGTITPSCAPAGAAGLAVFTGASPLFTRTVVDLDTACNLATGTTTGCANRSVRIGFTSITDCSNTNDGWFLDEVTVTACVL